jgi:hypothetical protein
VLSTLPPAADFELVPGRTGDETADSAVMVCGDGTVAIGLLRPGAPLTAQQLHALRGAEISSILVWAAPQDRAHHAAAPEMFDGPTLAALTGSVREAAVIDLPGERQMADCAPIIQHWQSAALDPLNLERRTRHMRCSP